MLSKVTYSCNTVDKISKDLKFLEDALYKSKARKTSVFLGVLDE